MSSTPYAPPKHPLEIMQKLGFYTAIEPDDPRFVETEEARGSPQTLDRLAKKFGVDLSTNEFFPPEKKHVLLFGYVGGGKSTELRHLTQKLRNLGQLYVVTIDVLNELDRSNLTYADAVMAIAKGLIEQLTRDNIELHANALADLENWYAQRIKEDAHSNELLAQLETGMKAETGLPFLGKLFANFTAAAKTNATYKDSIRIVIRNTFTQFATAFNEFLSSAEKALLQAGHGSRILFVMDGTDKLTFEDTKRFFIEDAEQLFAINALMLYTAPLSLKYDGIPLGRVGDIVLPIIKLHNRDDKRFEIGYQAMREMLLKRADASVFADDALIDAIIESSGGHPRELLRLLELCCEYAEGTHIDANTVEKAINALAGEYRRFLEPDDYTLLARIDRESGLHGGNDERTRRLLYRLALLEYNNGSWRRSHPVLRRLEGYVAARKKLDDAQEAV